MTATPATTDRTATVRSATQHRTRARRIATVLVACGVLIAAVLASLAFGARPVALSTVIDGMQQFVGAAPGDPGGGDVAVVLSRIPRTVVGILAGAALGLAGTSMQGLTRNPLADPGILGVNSGAAFAVVLAISVFGIHALTSYIWFALGGAAVACVLVYGIGSLGREGATPVKLALAGAALAAGLASLTNGILVTSQETLDTFRFWQVGALAGRGWEVVMPVLPFLVVGMVITLATGPALNGLALGDDVARGLGQRVGATRAVTAVGAVLLCGGATAMAGPIAFVGLVVPHALRAVVGPDYRWILALSLVVAPSLLLVADVAGRVVMPPGEVPAGILTAVIGAPVFVWLVRRGRRAGL